VTARAARGPSAGAVVTLAVYAFLYAPLIVLVLFSFNQARLGARWEGFTLEWYAAALRDQRVLAALRNSVVIALATTVVATAAGTAAALAGGRFRFDVRSFNSFAPDAFDTRASLRNTFHQRA